MTNITLEEFGGIPDAKDNSAAFKRILEKTRGMNGVRLVVGAGIWRTGPIELHSDMELHLDEGAFLSFIPEFERYPPVWTRWEGVECYAMHPCLFSTGSRNVSVTGSGVIDGGGKLWWQERIKKRGQNGPQSETEKKLASLNPDYNVQPGGGGGREIQFLRPSLVQFFNCSNVTLSGFTAQNSPFWTIHPVFCEQVRISDLTIKNPHDSCNTDGIDIDSCCGVEISGCTINVGDDGIALKSGSGKNGMQANKPTCNVRITDCLVGDGHGGIVIGSETAAGIRNVTAQDCVFRGTDRGIRIKTRRGRGGAIHNLHFKNLRMENNLCPIVINMFYSCGVSSVEDSERLFTLEKQPVTDSTPSVSDIYIENIRASGCKASAGFVAGLPEAPVSGLKIFSSIFEIDELSGVSPFDSDMCKGIPPVREKSFRLLNTAGAEFSDVRVSGPKKPFLFG